MSVVFAITSEDNPSFFNGPRVCSSNLCVGNVFSPMEIIGEEKVSIYPKKQPEKWSISNDEMGNRTRNALLAPIKNSLGVFVDIIGCNQR